MNHGDLEKLRDALSKLQKLAAGGRNPQSASLEKGWATGGRTVNDPLKTQVAKEFDESKHPRAADGKFGQGGGGNTGDQAADRWRAGTDKIVAEITNAPFFQGSDQQSKDSLKAVKEAASRGWAPPSREAAIEGAKIELLNLISDDPEVAIDYLSPKEQRIAEKEEWTGMEVQELASDKVRDLSEKDLVDDIAQYYYMDAEAWLEDHPKSKGEVSKADYDESKHERDQNGRFSSSGGGEGGSKESLESKQERLQSRLRNEGMHQSDALDEVASMSEDQIDERLGTSTDEQEDAAAEQEVDAEAQAQQEGHEYTEENYQSDVETLRSNRQYMDAKEYNEAIDRLAEGTGKSHDEIRGDIGATQDTGVDTNSPPSISSPAEFGRRAEARADKYGYFGTATSRDPQHDQYVVDRISRGLNQGPEKTEMILASAYGRHLADALHHTKAGLDRSKLVDKTVKEFNSKIGTKISSWGEFFKPEKSEKMVKGDWDESKHPRGDDGKFGEGGSGNGDDNGPIEFTHGDMPRDLYERAKELRADGMSYKDIVSEITENDREGRKWFNSGKYEGNEFNLRQELEGQIEDEKAEEEDTADEQRSQETNIEEARATERQQEDSRQAQAEREADEDMEAHRHEPYSQDLQEDGHDSEDERDHKDEEDPDVGKVADLMRAVADVINKQYFSLNKYIRRHGDKWTVYSEAGKPMGTYDSESGAKHRLQQIEYFKHRKDFGFNDLVKGIKHTTEALSQVIEEMNQQEAGKELAPGDVKQLEEIIETLNGIVNYLYESKERGHLKP